MNRDAETFAYLFEAKGIGGYITDTGRLIDLIGGSDLVAGLCTSDRDDVLAAVLAAAGAADLEEAGLEESRRAGGAFCLHAGDRDRLDRVRALWRLVVGVTCPGLSFTDTDTNQPPEDAAPNSDRQAPPPAVAALRAAYRRQPGLRENSGALLPPTGQPVTETDRRTGRVAVEFEVKVDVPKPLDDDVAKRPKHLDGVVAAMRRRGRDISTSDAQDRLARLFLPRDPAEAAPYRFPRHFETDEASRNNPAFPLRPGDRRVAVVHADISRLGETFRRVTERAKTPGEVFEAARCIEAAITRAARSASAAVLLPAAVRSGESKEDQERYAALFGPKDRKTPPANLAIVPARPVILGGDDITLIVRADLALAFAQALLEGIERETRAAFPAHAALGLPEYLTACAGVAVVGAGHPFLTANRMAEGMCKHAKTWAKEEAKTAGVGTPSSALTFGVITSTVDESHDDWHRREQQILPACPATAQGGAQRAALFATFCPYVATGAAARSLAALRALADVLDGAEGRGKLIEAVALRATDPVGARTQHDRFREVLAAEDSKRIERMDAALAALLGQAPADLDAALPVFNDALELIDIGATAVSGDPA